MSNPRIDKIVIANDYLCWLDDKREVYILDTQKLAIGKPMSWDPAKPDPSFVRKISLNVEQHLRVALNVCNTKFALQTMPSQELTPKQFEDRFLQVTIGDKCFVYDLEQKQKELSCINKLTDMRKFT